MKLGDAVKKITGAVGIKPCSSCERRRQRLNELSERIANAVGEERMRLVRLRKRILEG